MAQPATKTPVLEKLEEINARLTILSQRSENPKMDPYVEKAFEELRKEQVATKKELQEMREMAEAIQYSHKEMKGLLAILADPKARQAVDQAYSVKPITTTFEVSQADLAGKRKGRTGRPVGVKKRAAGLEKPVREPQLHGASWEYGFPSSVMAMRQQQMAAIDPAVLRQRREAYIRGQQARRSGQPFLSSGVSQAEGAGFEREPECEAGPAPAPPPLEVVVREAREFASRPPPTRHAHRALAGQMPCSHYGFSPAKGAGSNLWMDHAIVKLPDREPVLETIKKLMDRVQELQKQHKQDGQSLEKYRAESDKNGTLKEENERLKAQMASFKTALGIEEHKLQFDMDELKEKMVVAKVDDQPSTSAEPPRHETSDEDDFEKVKEAEKEDEEKEKEMEEDA